MAVQEKLLTAEEYGGLSGNDRPSELVKGVVVELPYPFFGHSLLQGEFGYQIEDYLQN